MTDKPLRDRLEPVARRRRQFHFWSRLAAGWAVAAGGALVVALAQRAVGWASSLTLPLVALAGTVIAFLVALRHRPRDPLLRSTATEIERQHPDLQGLLLTAVQQGATPTTPLNYFQRLVVREALDHSRRHDWSAAIPPGRIHAARWAQLGTLALFLVALSMLRTPGNPFRPSALLYRTAGVTVTPGDTTLERGENLVVLARFGSEPPAEAHLVVHGGLAGTERRIPLTRSLGDPVFGASLREVATDLTYHVEYGNERTRDFQVTVFEHPRLERADADLAFPTYTRLDPRRIEDTRRITAVEGTRLDLALQLNKPVTSATLASRSPEIPSIPLTPANNQPAALLSGFTLSRKAGYDLLLVDADGRTNKIPAPFTFDVLPNRTPEIKLLAPRGDVRPSALEEVRFDGTVWDDFGILAHGLAFDLIGQDTRFVELGRDLPAAERRTFQHLLPLEDLNVAPDQLVTWYAWADDLGPDGQPRRTTTDLLFAEIRPFEEIFRQGEGSAEPPSESAESEEQQGGVQDLVRVQKQIVLATWNLRRNSRTPSPAYADDVQVVADSQKQNLERAEERAGQGTDARAAELWNTVTEEMGTAIVRLGDASSSREALGPALASEQAAYQALLRLQARETEVTRSQRGRGQGGEAGNQRQLDQLDLASEDNRYETQRQAQAATSPERREQLQVLNRLQELARRQQDLNERLRELQTALQEARSEEERDTVRRELKRLQEEQQRLLADMDELEQRTQRPENQARMSELRQRLEQTREDMQRASEATANSQVSEALAAGTRAERQLSSMREELRQQNASEFAEDLRDLRAQALDLERQQEAISRDLASASPPSNRRRLDDANPADDLLQRLGEQKQRLTNLVARATELSQAGEVSEPLMSQQLYDTLRQLNQAEARSVAELQEDLLERGRLTRSLYERLRTTAAEEEAKSLETTAEMLRQGLDAEAAEASLRAEASLQSLRQGVDQAADSVLGDDTAGLRLARDELQNLADQLDQEIARATGGAGRTNAAAGGTGSTGQGSEGPPGTAPDSPGEDRSDGSPGGNMAGGGNSRGDGGGSVGGGNSGGSRSATQRLAEFLGGSEGDGTGSGPITTEAFAPWSDRLREVEELIDLPDLRNQVATARERARLTRAELRRDQKKPDWAVVRLQVLNPLVEVRRQLEDELLRRTTDDSLLPIDRDPVPTRYSELVRRYYEELGKDR